MLINEKLKIGRQEIFLKDFFRKNLISRIIIKIKIKDSSDKYAVESAIKIPKKSILWPIVFTETTRYCCS